MKIRFSPFILQALLLIIPMALAYLLFAGYFSFYYDDWYLVYAGHSQGILKFVDVYAIDRPARAFLVGAQYLLFGDHAPLYSVSAYLLRLAGAFAFAWIMQRVWPRARFLSLSAPLLFAIYPGFLDQTNAFDFQTHIASLTLALLSFVCTLEAIANRRKFLRLLFAVLAVLTTLAYLPLMEYYIGLEGLRFLLVFQLVASGHIYPDLSREGEAFWKKGLRALRAELPVLISALAFLVWRVFFFDATRHATNIGDMFSGLAGSSLRLAWMVVHLVQDYLSAVFLAWGVPAYLVAFPLRLKDLLLAIVLAAAGAALIVWMFTRLMRSASTSPGGEETENWTSTVFWVGSLAVLSALLPVSIGDRHIEFLSYSRFAFPASLGACMIVAALLYRIRAGAWRTGLFGLLCGLALLTHIGNASVARDQGLAMRDFWWQVAWRAPGIQPGTTLVVNSVLFPVVEDYIAWGPANLIYYPQYTPGSDGDSPVDPHLTLLKINAIVPGSQQDIQAIQMGGSGRRERRGFLSELDYGRALVLTMPTSSSCVNILDGRQPELSAGEDTRIQVIASRSQVDLVTTGGPNPVPPLAIFGPEPVHGWCYYYEKASLARQRGDWNEVIRLAEEAGAKGLHPIDRAEWFPLLQAYAYLGETDKAGGIVPIIKDVPYLKVEACRLFSSPGLPGAADHPDGQKFLAQAFCQ